MDTPQLPENQSIFNAPPRTMFALGIMVGVALISLLGFILSFSAYRNATSDGTKKVAGAATNTNTAVANTNTAPAGPVDVEVKSDDWIRGNKNAKVTLVEFSDFECPFCGRFNPTVDQVLKDYKDDVRVVFKHYPLTTIHPQAQKAAEAAECAGAQGKFWEMHDKMFTNQATLSLENMKKWAKEVGVKESTFNTCLDKGEMASKVSEDVQVANGLGVSGTPTSFVNGIEVSGAQTFDYVKSIIDQQLAAT
ncbi:MAG: thioredoxin domain-containing protein [Patescibacteria group bacterium]